MLRRAGRNRTSYSGMDRDYRLGLPTLSGRGPVGLASGPSTGLSLHLIVEVRRQQLGELGLMEHPFRLVIQSGRKNVSSEPKADRVQGQHRSQIEYTNTKVVHRVDVGDELDPGFRT